MNLEKYYNNLLDLLKKKVLDSNSHLTNETLYLSEKSVSKNLISVEEISFLLKEDAKNITDLLEKLGEKGINKNSFLTIDVLKKYLDKVKIRLEIKKKTYAY